MRFSAPYAGEEASGDEEKKLAAQTAAHAAAQASPSKESALKEKPPTLLEEIRTLLDGLHGSISTSPRFRCLRRTVTDALAMRYSRHPRGTLGPLAREGGAAAAGIPRALPAHGRAALWRAHGRAHGRAQPA